MEKTMSKKLIKPVSIAVGTAFVATVAAGNVSAENDANPFAINELSGGYMQLAYGGGESKDKEGAGKSGAEGKCGGEKAEKEGKCGEGKCGSDMKKNMEGKCGGEKAEKEGKCGEGKCGSSK